MSHDDNCAPCADGDHATIEPDDSGIERCTCCGEHVIDETQQGTVHVHANGVVELDPADIRATACGTCGRAWDDTVSTAVTPVPAGRCPFEYDHPEPVEPSADLLYRVNDALTAICDEAHVTLPESVLDDLVWTIARSLATHGERDEAR